MPIKLLILYQPYICRKAMLLNINNEKVSQVIVSDVLKDVVGKWSDVELHYFCVVESTLASGLMNYEGKKI